MNATSPRFYRYGTFNTRMVESLCHDELYFASPADFNDPFDCKPVVVPDSDLRTLQAVLRKLIERRVSAETLNALKTARLKGDKVVAYARRCGKQEGARELANIAYHATNPDYDCSKEEAERGLLAADIQRELLRQHDGGVCCFSETFKNPLLWSHYGDQHRGVCIGYGLDRLPRPEMHKVLYGGSRTVKSSLVAQAILEEDEQAIAALERDVLLRKAPEWHYEKEWRLRGSRGAQESCLRLIDVTFGFRCSGALKHALVSSLERRVPEVKFYEIRAIPGTFKLMREELDRAELSACFPKVAESGIEIFGNPEAV